MGEPNVGVMEVTRTIMVLDRKTKEELFCGYHNEVLKYLGFGNKIHLITKFDLSLGKTVPYKDFLLMEVSSDTHSAYIDKLVLKKTWEKKKLCTKCGGKWWLKDGIITCVKCGHQVDLNGKVKPKKKSSKVVTERLVSERSNIKS